MDAASAHLLNDDTARAASLLVRLRSQGADRLAPLAAAMLKEPLTVVQMLGGVITLAGVVLASRATSATVTHPDQVRSSLA